jgi:hypothetical protein
MGAGGEYILYTPDESVVGAYVITDDEYGYEFGYISLSVTTVFVLLVTVLFKISFMVYERDGIELTPVSTFWSAADSTITLNVIVSFSTNGTFLKSAVFPPLL